MTDTDLITALRRIAVQDQHRCLGCGYEHSCSIHGCQIIRAAADRLKELAEMEKKEKQQKWFTFRGRDFNEVHLNTDYIVEFTWVCNMLCIGILGETLRRKIPDSHRFLYDRLCDATGVEIVKGHPDPKGPRGMVGICPLCGTSDGMIWKPQTDESCCLNCGWSNGSVPDGAGSGIGAPPGANTAYLNIRWDYVPPDHRDPEGLPAKREGI